MWIKLVDKNQIENIKLGDQILQHLLDDNVSIINSIGNETNSEIYEVILKTIDGLSLQYFPPTTEFAGIALGLITRHVGYINLLDGIWWIKDDEN